MRTSVGTKTQVKLAVANPGRKTQAIASIEQAVAMLENGVYRVLEMGKDSGFQDVDFLYWSRKLKNVATPVSLALSEYRGPKRFHYHYRHDPDDYDTLYPVPGPTSISTLARVCREALVQCNDLVGMTDTNVSKAKTMFEQSIRFFLRTYGSSGLRLPA